MLERFYDPTSGKILLDGREIHEYDELFLHRQLAMVSQEPVLFNRTIEENILYGSVEDPDRDRMIEAARQANAETFINELSQGFQSKCGERGSHLSG